MIADALRLALYLKRRRHLAAGEHFQRELLMAAKRIGRAGVAGRWPFSLCENDRTSAQCRIRRAKSGKCSQTCTPGTSVAMGENSPRISAGASGFMSKVS